MPADHFLSELPHATRLVPADLQVCMHLQGIKFPRVVLLMASTSQGQTILAKLSSGQVLPSQPGHYRHWHLQSLHFAT